MIKDKSFKILFCIYVLAFIVDLISTLRMGELLKYLEANPFFKFGGLPLIIILNIVFAFGSCWLYKKGSITTRFIVIFGLIAIIMTRLIAITNSIAIYNNPPTLEQAMAVTQAMKTETMMRLVAVNIFPMFNGLIAWVFFKFDHHIIRK